MKKIAVVEKFFESHHQQQIETVAGKHGYTVDYYLDGVLPKERAGEYEIVYGMPDRTALKDMTQLKWFCASFAGVDRYVDEALYPHEGVLLSNSAGAYGVTIAEHIMMVTLMLLRQMMPTMKAVGERVWLPPLPVRSLCERTSRCWAPAISAPALPSGPRLWEPSPSAASAAPSSPPTLPLTGS